MKRITLLVVMVVSITSANAFGTQRPVDKPGGDDETVELKTTLVEVPVVVSEPGGRYVTDLKQSDFGLSENGEAQEITFFASVDEPFNVALVLDTSGSTRDQLDRIKAAASVFLDQLRPRDRVAIVTFEDEVNVLTPLTSDRAQLREALAGLSAGKFTQVYEAVHEVTTNVFAGVDGRRAAIFFTDGVDTASAIATYENSLDEITRRQIIVYPIRYNTLPDVEQRLGLADNATLAAPSGETRERRVSDQTVDHDKTLRELQQAYHVADAFLFDLATATGGVLYRADRLDDLPTAFARIADELRHQYLIGYYPEREDVTGDREIRVTVVRPGVEVRSRKGYHRASAPAH